MAYKPFKMRGSPMQRNFGIGSPVKHPHRTWEEATSHGKDEPHVKTEVEDTISQPTKEVKTREQAPPPPEVKKKPKKTKPVVEVKEQAPPEKKEEVRTRPTSWWLGEEGFIPDEFQPWVNRPRVPIEKRKKKKK